MLLKHAYSVIGSCCPNLQIIINIEMRNSFKKTHTKMDSIFKVW